MRSVSNPFWVKKSARLARLAFSMRSVFCCEYDIASSFGFEYADIAKPPEGDLAILWAVIVFVNGVTKRICLTPYLSKELFYVKLFN